MWENYRDWELAGARPLLAALGFTLEEKQPHLSGERYLMSPHKLVLLARGRDGQRVVVKTSSQRAGVREIDRERSARRVLDALPFSYQPFHSPEELFYGTRGGYRIFATAFIEQPSTFLARPLREQFSLALQGLRAQEAAHATTYEHARIIRKAFGAADAERYLACFTAFARAARTALPEDAELARAFRKAEEFLRANQKTIEQYCGFLTHADFVPHNFRVKDGVIYLIDHNSLTFGNKYESWARFINFMEIHNPALAEALVAYVRLNRTREEALALRLMRVYKVAQLVARYYARALPNTSGDLRALTLVRIAFWREMLEALVEDRALPAGRVEEYVRTRDSLQSEEEKARQKELH